jgi:glycerate 2-kinase
LWMKIVIAPDSFKENLTSLEVASEIEKGLLRVWPNAECVKVPMADGGEGTVQSLVDATGGTIVRAEVLGPMGVPVLASYGLLGDGRTAVIEMAEASGLPLVAKEERNPLVASTFGTGQLISDAIHRGVEEIIIGLGGSATNDGGAGLAQALGVRFIGTDGAPIVEPLGGGRLAEVQGIDLRWVNPALPLVHFSVACDVTNPLTGERGASAVYGPQKGATPEMTATLDSNLANFAAVIKRDLGMDIAERSGAGAGGGVGASLMAFTNSTLKRGVELVVAATKLEDFMQGADLAITGEGRVDFQTAFGKTPSGVATAAHKFGVPVVAIGGGLSDDAGGVFQHGIDGLETATPNAMPLEVAIEKSRQYLQDAAERVARLIVVGERVAAAASGGAAAAGAPAARQWHGENRPMRGRERPKRVVGMTHAALELARRRRQRS